MMAHAVAQHCGHHAPLLLLALATSTLPAQLESATLPPSSVDVFSPGMTNTQGETYQCARIPSAVFDAHSGHLLAFAECRHGVGDGCVPAGVKTGPGGTDLCARVSADQGRSWGNLTTLAKNAGQPTATYVPAAKLTLLEFNAKSGPGCGKGRGGSCCPVF